MAQHAEALSPQRDLALLVANTTTFQIEDEGPERQAEFVLCWQLPHHLQSVPHRSMQLSSLSGMSAEQMLKKRKGRRTGWQLVRSIGAVRKNLHGLQGLWVGSAATTQSRQRKSHALVGIAG
ncbi:MULTISPECIES: hypothetical protein [unclassified Bradyrhizobium]|uniref:hypothetical protein n=1 Tax=unclassified Bradyrhizobium TaxID=2631580 RepID=UPI0024E175D2|nr:MULTISPECIES: hypothetical protein [unclassified Bradyrhizobium]